MPRMGLTRQRVVAEAGAVADEAGLDRLVLAAVAKRLGVTLPGLYKHIDSLDGLRRDLAVLGVRDLTEVMAAAAVGKSGRAALQASRRLTAGTPPSIQACARPVSARPTPATPSTPPPARSPSTSSSLPCTDTSSAAPMPWTRSAASASCCTASPA